jgi:hypothetical protein
LTFRLEDVKRNLAEITVSSGSRARKEIHNILREESSFSAAQDKLADANPFMDNLEDQV